MTPWSLALASLRRHAGAWAAVAAPIALSSALIGGGLLVGASLEHTLDEAAKTRIGPYTHAVVAGEHPVSIGLAERMAGLIDGSFDAAIRLRAVAQDDVGLPVPNLIVWGLDDGPPPGTVALSPVAAAALHLQPGDDLVLRVQRPAALPAEVALTLEDDARVALRTEVHEILPNTWPAGLSLTAQPDPPANLFADATWLAEQLDLGDLRQVLLVTSTSPDIPEALDQSLSALEIGLEVASSQEHDLLTSPRILLPPALNDVLPASASGLVWLHNGLSHGQAKTGYGFVGAVDPAGTTGVGTMLPDDLGDDHIVLLAPIAARLGVEPGDTVTLNYPSLGTRRAVTDHTAQFTVHDVVPVEGAFADPSWMPALPGVVDAPTCADWAPGLPVDLERINAEDEAWWTAHGGTPQAWVTLNTASRLWGTPWGDRTQVRLPSGEGERLLASLPGRLHAADLGLLVDPIATRMAASARPANDFGPLFLGFEFVLLVSSLLLTSLTLGFTLETRRRELGLLSAIGWPAARIWWQLLREVALVAGLGALIGLPCSVAVQAALLFGLEGAWSGAVSGQQVIPSLDLTALAGGVFAASALALLVGAAQTRRLMTQPPRDLLVGRPPPQLLHTGRHYPLALMLLLGAVATVFFVPAARSPKTAAAFFVAGGLLLAAGGLTLHGLWSATRTMTPRTLTVLAASAAGRRRGRSLAASMTLALGIFLVIGVRLAAPQPPADARAPDSGTGGFAHLLTTELPIIHPLTGPEGAEAWGWRDPLDADAVLPLRRLPGDVASCEHLGSAQTPMLLGVDPARLEGHFRMMTPDRSWRDLVPSTPGRLAAVGDVGTVQWGLHLDVGDVLPFVDEHGDPVDVEIVGVVDTWVLQGGLVVDEQALRRHWPSLAQIDHALLHALPPGMDSELRFALADLGPSLTDTGARLERLMDVERTYINIFGALGTLGVLLGTLGLGLVVLRNIQEREGELALLRAIGWSRTRLAQHLWVEHTALLLGGMGIGLAASLVAVRPALLTPGVHPPWALLAVLLVGTLLLGLGSTALAAWWATRRTPARALSRTR